jgi:hypothetical protein
VILYKEECRNKLFVDSVHGMHWHTNWFSAADSTGEQSLEDGFVRPKHVATECDFGGILKQMRDSERSFGCIRDGNECTSYTLKQRNADIILLFLMFLSNRRPVTDFHRLALACHRNVAARHAYMLQCGNFLSFPSVGSFYPMSYPRHRKKRDDRENGIMRNG